MKKLIFILFTLIFAFNTASAENPSIDKILDRHAEAIGGMEAIENFKSVHMQAEVQLGNLAGSAETWFKKPGKFKLDMDLAIMQIEQGMYEGRMWIKDQTGTVRDMAGMEKKQFVTEYKLSNFSYLLDPEVRKSFTFKGVEEFDGKGCYVLEFKPPEGDKFTMFFDTLDYLVVGSKTTLQGIPVKSTSSDWRIVEGIKVPFRTVQDLGNPMLLTTITVTGIEVNEDIPDIIFMPPTSGSEKFRFVNDADSGSLEFTLNIHHIYIQVHVNGAGPFWFLLDSGAGMSILEKRIADSLGMEDAGNLPAIGVGGIDVGNFVKVDSLKLGNVTLLDFAAGALDLSFADDMLVQPIQGILGYDLFSRLIVDIDYPANLITIYDPAADIYPGRADTLELEIETNHPVIKAFVNDSIEGRFRFDTGSSNFLDLNAPFVKKNNLLDNVVKELGTFPIMGIGGESESTIAILPAFTIGKYRLDNLMTGFNQMETGIFAAENIDGNIGGGIMKWFALGFDYPENKLYLTKITEDDSDDAIISSGLLLKPEGDGFVVYKIIEGTPAADSGLQENDKLIAVNGEKVAGLEPDAVYEMLDGDEGDLVKIEYEREGESREVQLELEDLTKLKDE